MAEDLIQVVADNVRQRRLQLGWSQEHLADLAGLHRAYVGAIERAQKNVTLSTLARIGAALQVQPAVLLHPSESR